MESIKIGNEHAHDRWLNIWEKGLKIGDAFDTGSPSPCLIKEIEEGRVPNGRALVPGCGRGYDVYALATSERIAIGLDLSIVAVNEAQALGNRCQAVENAIFRQGNFFELNIEEKFDFIYDYTFLCALDPSIRSDWAKMMSDLVKPGGILLTLIFPICEKTGGPPFAMSLNIVQELLMTGPEAGKWSMERLELLPSELCHAGRDGSPGGFVRPGMIGGGAASGIGRWVRSL